MTTLYYLQGSSQSISTNTIRHAAPPPARRGCYPRSHIVIYLSSTYFAKRKSMEDINAFVIYVIHVTRQQSRGFNNIRGKK